ncbi:hypothetical protein EYF80_060614 [Liparis tanakae]|uniref:Uncharacterized protein n=1 Tax=Liparis tanakae TaxID=230148 RepID=A0A4Z2EKA1_9TELE|nr:hypothetical protein EYF80_060614 [Liparis tanakae]
MVYHVLNDRRWRVELMRQVVGKGHLPGIDQMNVQSSEHGFKHLVALQRVPVAVAYRHGKCQNFEVPGPDDDQRIRSPVQQTHHRPADALQPPDVDLHGDVHEAEREDGDEDEDSQEEEDGTEPSYSPWMDLHDQVSLQLQ